MLSLPQLRGHLLALPGAVEDYPFGPEHLVCKVGGKMFALIALSDEPLRLNLKCDPEHAEVLRGYLCAAAENDGSFSDFRQIGRAHV